MFIRQFLKNSVSIHLAEPLNDDVFTKLCSKTFSLIQTSGFDHISVQGNMKCYRHAMPILCGVNHKQVFSLIQYDTVSCLHCVLF